MAPTGFALAHCTLRNLVLKDTAESPLLLVTSSLLVVLVVVVVCLMISASVLVTASDTGCSGRNKVIRAAFKQQSAIASFRVALTPCFKPSIAPSGMPTRNAIPTAIPWNRPKIALIFSLVGESISLVHISYIGMCSREHAAGQFINHGSDVEHSHWFCVKSDHVSWP